tara:strand:+ start:239 stop:1000 length:762 start_codon:yes stop_codon:yes gene_type:complete
MATTTAQIILTSADLLSDSLSLSSTATLTNAGGSTGVTQTTGLARKTTSYAGSGVIDTTVLYRADDYTADKANKIYLKNTSTTDSEYFIVYMTGDRATAAHDASTAASDITGLTEIGRLYAGDWAFFPWNATGGTAETFTAVVGNTWAAGDTIEFDGVTIVAKNSTVANIATQIDNAQFPNWVTSVSSATVTFVARYANAGIEIDTSEIVATTAGNGDLTISTTVEGTRSVADIYIKPSVHTAMTLEHMLFYE